MKKIILSVALVAASFTTVAQVGIGTMTPIGAFNVDGLSDNSETPTAEELENDFVILNNGKLGLGTATPRTKVEIRTVGKAYLTLNSIGNNSGIRFSKDDAHLYQLSTSSDNSLMFTDLANAIERMRITSEGNVGIGTPMPTSKLQVVGLQIHENNADAKTAGLTQGAFYRNADGVVRVVR